MRITPELDCLTSVEVNVIQRLCPVPDDSLFAVFVVCVYLHESHVWLAGVDCMEQR